MEQVITKENILELLSSEDVIEQSYMFFVKHNKKWKISKSVTIELSTGEVITIPEGYVYDMSSVPRFLWSIISPFNDGLFGTLIHDYLYVTKIVSRKTADDEYLFWNKITYPNKFDNYLRYIAVRLFGWIVWNNIIRIK